MLISTENVKESNQTEMKYLLLKPSISAGIGDQVLALISAVAYARLTNRVLSVDWRGGLYGMPRDENLFDRLFEVSGVEIEAPIPEDRSVCPAAWKGRLEKSFDQVRKEDKFESGRHASINIYSVDVTRLDYDEDVLVMYDFSGFKKMIPDLIENRIIKNCKSQTKAIEQIFDRYVHFKEGPSLFLHENWEKISSRFLNGRVIGVHVRETQESFDTYGQLKRNRYYNQIDSILERNSSVKSIFLATDNAEVQAEFKSKYGDKIFYKEKWFAEVGSPLHQSLDDCPDNWVNLMDAIFDIYALSQCDYLIRREESSFSKLSECIGVFENDKVKILSPEKSMREKISLIKQ